MSIETAMKVAAVLGVATAVFCAGYTVRGYIAMNDMAAYVQQEQKATDAANQQSQQVEKADTANTQASTQRLDAAEAIRVPEVQYVTQEVIKYRDRPVAGKCTLPLEWVRLYNRSGTGQASDVSKAGTAGPSVAGSTAAVH